MIRILAAYLLLATSCVITAEPTPEPLEFTKWSGELNVPDPVAISLDNLGRAFVSQTQRRKSQDLDIRQNQDWVSSDVSLQSVREKMDFYHRELAPGDDLENREHVNDMNEDGRFDFRDLTVLSEKIHLLEDSNNDGTADTTRVFAEDFRTEVTGIAAGVLHHDGQVYATIAPDVWKMPATVQEDQVQAQRSKLATGFGLHIAYAGHDMHGLTVGPDGKIYWSIGDKGISTVSQEGVRLHFPNQGGVLRCNPDGSDLEVFAHGLRNVQELAFDQWGNLFGVDNDADKPGERERFVYIVKGMDAGWRCNYQYRGKDYDPWMAEGLWQTQHERQPAYIIPPISHSIDGPAGFAFNPGTALSPAYKDFFFLTGAPNGNQIAFQVERDGASFRMTRQHSIGNGLPLVGINFGPDGALYAVDWGGGYPLNQTGAVWKVDAPQHSNSTLRQETNRLLAKGFTSHDLNQLTELLGHPDQRVRLGAQFELVKRSSLPILIKTSTAGPPMLARIHAVWGLGQIARRTHNEQSENAADASRHLHQLLNDDSDPRFLEQVIRTIGDLDKASPIPLSRYLSNSDPGVRFMAASALGDHPSDSPEIWERLIAFANDTSMSETYLRFALSRALAACGTDEMRIALKQQDNELLSLAAVVALRRNSSPALSAYLNASQESVTTEAALAIHDDFSVPIALPVLAESLTTSNSQSEAFVRRAINANFRIGTATHAERLVAYGRDMQRPLEFRRAALEALALWTSPPKLDLVTGRARDWALSPRTTNEKVAEGLSHLLADKNSAIKVATLSAVAALEVQVEQKPLTNLVLSEAATPAVRLEALRLLESQEAPELLELSKQLVTSESASVRIKGLELLSNYEAERATREIKRVLQTSKSLSERQAATRLLGEIDNVAAKELLQGYLGRIQARDTSVQEIHLEIRKAVRLSPTADYSECRSGGNSENGRVLFETHIGAQCARCHRIGRNGSDVGPRLDGIASKRDIDHLLRAIINPSADIEQKYQTTTVLLDSGTSIQGVVLKRSDLAITVLDQQGKEHKIDTADIEESIEQNISIMPNMSKVLSRREIRDLVAYLLTLK